LTRQEENRKKLERDRLDAEFNKNRLLMERRRKKEDEELKLLQLEKSLRIDDQLAADRERTRTAA
jgi:hypothetical protein